MAYSWPSHCKRYLESMEEEKQFLKIKVRIVLLSSLLGLLTQLTDGKNVRCHDGRAT